MDWKKPSWWTPGTDASWQKVREGVVAELHKLGGEAQKLEKSVAEAAAAFGHGARTSYANIDTKVGVWSKEVEARLKADWEQTHQESKVAWEKVSAAARHGWERAHAAVGGKPPESRAK